MKFLKVLGFLGGAVLLLVLIAVVYLKVFLPDTGDPQVIEIEQTPDRITRGRYLANHVTLCMDCHSTRDWSRYSGPMLQTDLGGGGELFSEDMGFPGKFYAANITPHKLGDWTDGEILRAVTTGVNRDGKALFPIMGYPRFGRMDQEDIYSIIAYIRTLEPVNHEIPGSEPAFPVNFLINTMPKPAAFSQKPDPSDVVSYGKYLTDAAGCVDCHSRTDKGQIIPGTEYGGGFEFLMPSGIVRSANITPDKESGIGAWTRDIFVQRFKMYTDSTYVLPTVGPTEMNTPMPWQMYAGMTTSDLEAIYTYLMTLEPKKSEIVKFSMK